MNIRKKITLATISTGILVLGSAGIANALPNALPSSGNSSSGNGTAISQQYNTDGSADSSKLIRGGLLMVAETNSKSENYVGNGTTTAGR